MFHSFMLTVSLLLPLTQTLHEIAAIAVWSATAGGAISLLNENI